MKFVLLAFAAILLLVACGGGDDAGSASMTAAPDSESTATSAADAVATPTAGAASRRPAWTRFYIEATVRSRSAAETPGTNLTPAADEGFTVTDVQITWSSESLERFRQELVVSVAGGPPEETHVIGTGEEIVFYDVAGNRFQTNPYPQGQDNLVAVPIPASIVLGPPSTPNLDAPFDGAIEMLERLTGREEGLLELGEDTIAGRATRIFETGPVACETHSDTGQRDCRGTVTVWIDAETGFILRYEAEDPGLQDVVVEVTRVEYGVSFTSGTFAFDPPPGAVETTP